MPKIKEKGERRKAKGRRQKENHEIVRRNKPPLYEVERGLGGEYMRRRSRAKGKRRKLNNTKPLTGMSGAKDNSLNK